MPQPVAEIVEALAVAGLEDAVLGVEVADVGQVLVQAQLVVLARLDLVSSGPKWRAKSSWLSSSILVGEDEHGILGEGGADGGKSSAASGLPSATSPISAAKSG